METSVMKQVDLGWVDLGTSWREYELKLGVHFDVQVFMSMNWPVNAWSLASIISCWFLARLFNTGKPANVIQGEKLAVSFLSQSKKILPKENKMNMSQVNKTISVIETNN